MSYDISREFLDLAPCPSPDREDQRLVVEHRSNARWQFIDELDRAERLLRDNPELGVGYAVHRRDIVRKLLLPQSEHHLYYRYRAQRGELVVLAVWGATRGHGPTFARSTRSDFDVFMGSRRRLAALPTLVAGRRDAGRRAGRGRVTRPSGAPANGFVGAAGACTL